MVKLEDLFIQNIKNRGFSKRSIESYSYDIKKFLRFIRTDLKMRKIKDITKKHIGEYQSYLFYHKNSDGKNYSIKTQIGKLGVVRIFFDFMVKTNRMLVNPAREIELPKEDKRLSKRALKQTEVRKIFTVIDMNTFYGYRDIVILELLYTTGIRVSELINLKLKDIKFEENQLLIEKGKGNQDRYVPLCEKTKLYLKEYIENVRPNLLKLNKVKKNDGYVFLSRKGEKIRRRSSISYSIKKYAKKAGIKGEIGAHNFRVTCATEMMKQGADERYVQELLGHRKLESTQRYLKIEIEDLKGEHIRMHPRSN